MSTKELMIIIMGFIRDIFEEKVMIWEGANLDLYNTVCDNLKSNGIKVQAFKVNQDRPKCDGNCASCMGTLPESKPDDKSIINYDLLGTGCKDDLLEKPLGYDIYAIYVKKSDVSKARSLMKTVS